MGGGSLANTGTIAGGQGGVGTGRKFGGGSSSGGGGVGISLSGSGSITNSGTVTGGKGGIDAADLAGSGIVLADGGAVVNGGAGGITALIRGGTGIRAAGTTGATVTNFGTIAGTFGFGVDLTAGGTIFDAGTIIGGAGSAIEFGGTTSNLLDLEHGYALVGGVIGGGGARNTMELAGSAGAAATVAYNGLGLTNFQQVLFGPGGYDALKVSNTSGALPVTISGFAQTSEVIDLTAIGTDGGITSFDTVTHQLIIGGSLGTVALQLDATDATRFRTESDGAGGTDLLTPCFLAGTRILTETGERPVESLAAGELVLTASGEARPIVWIGAGRALATRGRRNAATPVIVRKGALADNVPRRDLRITKGHSLYIDDVLIPVEFLVNHRSILWDDHAQEVTVYHIELATHDVMLADGAPAESYRDDGNRWLFQNASSGWAFPPKQPCAPVLTGGPVVDAVWRRLLARTGPLPYVPMTGDPDLHLLVDGQRVDGSHRPNGYRVFDLPRCPSALRVVSRAGSPAELGTARDPRLLGVALRQVRLWHSSRLRMLDASDESLAEGFHAFEPDNGFRWTNGDAALPATLFAGITGACQLELLVGGAMRYPLFAEALCRAAA